MKDHRSEEIGMRMEAILGKGMARKTAKRLKKRKSRLDREIERQSGSGTRTKPVR